MIEGILRTVWARLRTGALEVPEASGWIGWLWVPLVFLMAAPFPLSILREYPIPERATPIFWLLMAGTVCLAARIAVASGPFALLLLWGVVRAAFLRFPLRDVQVLLLMALVGLLYAVARDLTDAQRRWVTWGLVAGLGWEALLGGLNLFGIYPWMSWIDPAYFGRPMGLLTHVNYYGSFLALGLPFAWSVLGLPAAVGLFLLILATLSAGPVISASVGVLFLLWPEIGRRSRVGIAALFGGVIAVVMTVHEWRLSGRSEMWRTAWPEAWKHPFTGQGPGSYRMWVLDYNQSHNNFFPTYQTHNEPYQLFFELGIVALVVGGLWAWQAVAASRRVLTMPLGPGAWWKAGRLPLERAAVGTLVVAVVNMWGSPTFHLPGQAAFVLLALALVQAGAARLGPLSASRTSYRVEIGKAPKARRKKSGPDNGRPTSGAAREATHAQAD